MTASWAKQEEIGFGLTNLMTGSSLDYLMYKVKCEEQPSVAT